MNTLDMAAVALHETYEAYLRAGFNKREALYIVAMMVIHANGE